MFPNTSGLLLQAPSPLPASGSGGEAESERLARSFGGVSRIILGLGEPWKNAGCAKCPGEAKPKN